MAIACRFYSCVWRERLKLYLLSKFLRVSFNGNHLVIFIYDRNHDILEGVKYAFIDNYHSFCLMNLKGNLKDMVKGVSSSYR